jgi:8-oxo-dGTP diphosphatase
VADVEDDPAMTRRTVVAAAIVRGGRLLAARRSAPPALAGGWELPGGKVEAGESEQAALVRECREELGVSIGVEARIGPSVVIDDRFELHTWRVRLLSGEPAALQDHDELRWIGPGTLDELPWLPADVSLLPALRDTLLAVDADRPANSG